MQLAARSLILCETSKLSLGSEARVENVAQVSVASINVFIFKHANSFPLCDFNSHTRRTETFKLHLCLRRKCENTLIHMSSYKYIHTHINIHIYTYVPTKECEHIRCHKKSCWNNFCVYYPMVMKCSAC